MIYQGVGSECCPGCSRLLGPDGESALCSPQCEPMNTKGSFPKLLLVGRYGWGSRAGSRVESMMIMHRASRGWDVKFVLPIKD